MSKICLKYIALAPLIALVCLIAFVVPNSIRPALAEGQNQPITKTITEIGNPTITSTSYFDDGTLYYTNLGSTVGYNYDHTNTIFDFDLVFNSLQPSFAGWFGFSLKVSAFDRHNAPALEQKGYGIRLCANGVVKLTKGGLEIESKNVDPLIIDKKYNIKLGAINVGEKVNIIFKIDNVEVIDVIDEDNPYLTGNWFNMNGDGSSVSAEIITTKPERIPSYQTYTLSTLGQYPSCANLEQVSVDRYNNINFKGAGASVGFNQLLQNFSFETKINFSTFSFPANFWITARATNFNRSPYCGGYSFRFSSSGGGVWVYKDGQVLASGSLGMTLETNKDYIIEIGTVDLSITKTYLFIKCNGKIALGAFDTENPLQRGGYLNINGEGEFSASLKSSNIGLTPLQTVFEEDSDEEIVKVYFLNSIAYQNLDYNDFSIRNLKSILINDVSIYSLNQIYYSGNNSNAIDIKYYDNVLEIRKSKQIFSKTTDSLDDFSINNISIKKTSSIIGIETMTNFLLKETYYASKN